MRFWWVNHRQTFRQEFGGKYMWCPKRDKRGNPNHFWENMREVRPGDLVLSYAGAAVQGFGFAKTHCYSCPRPDEFGKVGEAWISTGWRVDVDFQRFSSPFRTIGNMEHLAELLPGKYSPIKENGKGNQRYLSEVSELLVRRLAELAEPMLLAMLNNNVLLDNQDSIEVEIAPIMEWEELEQKKIEAVSEIPETQRKALVYARRGQGLFKENVSRFEHACRITHVDNPTHLIASHIKPWRESSNEERLQGGNGFLLTPSIDHLFDRGFITFADDGELVISPIADQLSLSRMGVPVDESTGVGRFNSDQKHFLEYHRQEIFLKSAS